MAGAFNRGHVERLRPRVQSLAASLLDDVDPAGFDVIGEYAEPLPVLVIAELIGLARTDVPSLRRWSQAIVRMYEPAPSEDVVAAAVSSRHEFSDHVREHLDRRRSNPADDLTTDLLAAGLSDDELVAAVVLLLNAGHEASVNVFGNGLVALLDRSLRPGADPALTVEEMLRFDSALQLFERTATSPVEVGESSWRRGSGSPHCSARPTGTLPSSPSRTPSTPPGTRTRTSRSAPGCTSAWGLRSPGWSSSSR